MKTRNLLLLALPLALSVSACSGMNTEARYPSGADRSSTNGDIYAQPKGIFGEHGVMGFLDDDDQDQAEEIAHIKQAKISLMDAMKAAEKETKGTAVKAKLDDKRGLDQYKIEILKDNKFLDVIVDSMTGKVLTIKADKED